MKYKIIEGLIALVLLLVFFSLRTYRLDYPLADWHSYRQADTASVARNFYKDGINLLYPQSDSLLALSQNQLPNPNRYFINEFPLYNATVALLYQQFGVHEWLGRMVSIVVSTFGALALYLLMRSLFHPIVAIFTLLLYTFNPYQAYYSRVFMPDPSFVSFSIIALYFNHLYVTRKSLLFQFLYILAIALATLIKPYAVFIYLPIVYWQVINLRWGFFKPLNLLGLIVSTIPLVLWRYHVSLHPEGQFASQWLLNGGNIRFTGAFFRWIIFERFNKLIFATGGFVLFMLGVFASTRSKAGKFLLVWLISILAYITIFAKGNVTHDYYQLPIVPIGIALAAIGGLYQISRSRSFGQLLSNLFLVGVLSVLMVSFGWFEVRGYFNVNRWEIIQAGKRVDELTPKDSLVVAPYMGDPAFLYHTNRHGWTIGGDITLLQKQGASIYVSVNYDDEANRLLKQYQTIEANDRYLILDLTKPL